MGIVCLVASQSEPCDGRREGRLFFSGLLERGSNFLFRSIVRAPHEKHRKKSSNTNKWHFKKCFGMLVGCWLASLEEGTLSEMKTWAQDYPAPTVGLFGRLGCNASYSVHECCFEL